MYFCDRGGTERDRVAAQEAHRNEVAQPAYTHRHVAAHTLRKARSQCTVLPASWAHCGSVCSWMNERTWAGKQSGSRRQALKWDGGNGNEGVSMLCQDAATSQFPKDTTSRTRTWSSASRMLNVLSRTLCVRPAPAHRGGGGRH